MFTLLVTSGLLSVTTAVVVGILPSMAPSAALLAPLTVRSTCEPAGTTIFTVTAILKVTVITSTKERREWDSGLEVAPLATRMLTRIQAGGQCPGSSLKKFPKLSSKQVTRDESLDFLKNRTLYRENRKLHCCSFKQTFVSTDLKLLYQLWNKVQENY